MNITLIKTGKGEYDAYCGGEVVASVFRGWSRLGGEGWQYVIPNQGISLTKKTLAAVKKSIAEKLKSIDKTKISI